MEGVRTSESSVIMAAVETTCALIQLEPAAKALQIQAIDHTSKFDSQTLSSSADESNGRYIARRLIDTICSESDALLDRASADPSEENSTVSTCPYQVNFTLRFSIAPFAYE
jgi:hypothetical protein